MGLRYIIVKDAGFNTCTVHGPFDFTTSQMVDWVKTNIGGDYHHEDDKALHPESRGTWRIGYPATVTLT